MEDHEIEFLMEDIEEPHSHYPIVQKTTARLILVFDRIVEKDTLLTIYNFISTNELKFKIFPIIRANKKAVIKIELY